ncbi:MAG TPA: HAD family hydrolase [Candidatus Dormibacteraeota bacterium]|nr:HAD family hydrolase [Candidatus Dormibacteraeota bacterium]
MPVRVVGFDGDDTLWHSETRFHVTQGKFRDLLKRHAPDAEVDVRLGETEMKNLAIYGYGVKSFTLSMLETAIEITDGQIPAGDLEVILGWGKEMLMDPTQLLDGVESTLQQLSGHYDLVVITKGDLFDQESKLAASGLADMFLGVEIVSEKNIETYRAVFKRRGIRPEEFVMVGNSLRSDIVPVVALGGHALHIRYEVTWAHEEVSAADLPNHGWRALGSIREVPAALETVR